MDPVEEDCLAEGAVGVLIWVGVDRMEGAGEGATVLLADVGAVTVIVSEGEEEEGAVVMATVEVAGETSVEVVGVRPLGVQTGNDPVKVINEARPSALHFSPFNSSSVCV
jgi:hypothetical protein